MQVVDSQGKPIDPDSWPQTIDYNGDNTVNFIQITHHTGVWRQTYTYNGSGLCTGVSAWIKQ